MDAAPFQAEIRDLADQPTVAARVTAPSNELTDLFSRVPVSVLSQLQWAGAQPSGPLYARYHAFGPDQVDVEIGFPVEAPIEALPSAAEVGPGEVGNSSLPACRAGYTVHRGTYDGLPASYDRLHDWIEARGHGHGDGPWEVYVDDPGDMTDMSATRTEIVWPLA
jgi:effector-binding domain-containing protein